MKKCIMMLFSLTIVWCAGTTVFAEEPAVATPETTVQETAGAAGEAAAATSEAAASSAGETAAPAETVKPAEPQTPESPYGWKPEVVGNLNLSQSEFDNWGAGGEDTLTWQVLLKGKYENLQKNYEWTHSGKLSYGETKTGSADMVKSDDSVKLESVFTYNLNTLVNPYAALKGETQIAPGYDYAGNEKVKVSDFLDPGYFTESLGLGYKAGDVFETRLGFAARQTVSDEFAAVYSDDRETPELEKIKNELGLESVSTATLKLSDMLLLTSGLTLFSNLKTFDQIDIRWENVLTASITKHINVNLTVEMVYDKDVSTRRQLKEVLAVGMTYSLFN